MSSPKKKYIYNPLWTYGKQLVTEGGAENADEIQSRATGTVQATTVQEAITELALEKVQADDPVFFADINANNNRIVNLADPVDPKDAVNKTYLESFVNTKLSGLQGIFFAGTYDAQNNVLLTVSSEGTNAGFTAGNALPAASQDNKGAFLIVTVAGTGTAPAPVSLLSSGDWIISDGVDYSQIDFPDTQHSQNVAYDASTNGIIQGTNVQEALDSADSYLQEATLSRVISGQIATVNQDMPLKFRMDYQVNPNTSFYPVSVVSMTLATTAPWKPTQGLQTWIGDTPELPEDYYNGLFCPVVEENNVTYKVVCPLYLIDVYNANYEQKLLGHLYLLQENGKTKFLVNIETTDEFPAGTYGLRYQVQAIAKASF